MRVRTRAVIRVPVILQVAIDLALELHALKYASMKLSAGCNRPLCIYSIEIACF